MPESATRPISPRDVGVEALDLDPAIEKVNAELAKPWGPTERTRKVVLPRGYRDDTTSDAIRREFFRSDWDCYRDCTLWEWSRDHWHLVFRRPTR